MSTEYGRAIAKNIRKYLYKKDSTAAEMSRALGIPKSTISQWMNASRIPRGEAVEMLCDYLGITPAQLVAESEEGTTRSIKIPVYGKVAAGIPMEMIEDITDEEEIPASMLRGGKEYFALTIRGDSMQPRMMDGDVVIVLKQDDAESGDIVIAAINGDDATCKRMRKHHDGVEFIPLNPSHSPKFFTNEEIRTLPVRILGKVVELRGKF